MDVDKERRTSSANIERKIFRIYGPKYENGEWKSRTNRELEEMSKGENIAKSVFLDIVLHINTPNPHIIQHLLLPYAKKAIISLLSIVKKKCM